MKKPNKMLVMLSIFLSTVLCQSNVWALSNDDKELNYLIKDEMLTIENNI